MQKSVRLGTVLLFLPISGMGNTQMPPEIMKGLQDQVETACGPNGWASACEQSRANLELAKKMNHEAAAGYPDDGDSSSSSGSNEIPKEYQTSDADALAVMNKQKAELCSPSQSGQEETCRMMEKGRQMLLAKMRGEDGVQDTPSAAAANSSQMGCVVARVQNANTTSPRIVLSNQCGKRIFFNVCTKKQGGAGRTLMPGQTAAASESKIDLWTPRREKFTWAYRWTYTDPAPAAAC